ncbi:MAG: hypothetical protein ACOCWA_02695 [Bacteroidota bacterium]
MKRNILHIIIALAIIVSTLNAYADGKKNEKKIKSAKARTEKVAERFSSATETNLELETWMVSINEFSFEEMFYEEELKLETWMVETESFNAEMAIGKKMEFKEWMMEPFEIEELEMELSFEEWMMKPFAANNATDNFQKEELTLEGWMMKF